MAVDDYKREAAAAVDGVNVEDLRAMLGRTSVVLVDIRERDEIDSSGMIDGAVHVPRGVLEFYIDPSSSMHMGVFSAGKPVVFYCETGGRSLLAAKLAKDMGIAESVYLEGGYVAWQASGKK